jgi:hypothetical protein
MTTKKLQDEKGESWITIVIPENDLDNIVLARVFALYQSLKPDWFDQTRNQRIALKYQETGELDLAIFDVGPKTDKDQQTQESNPC